MIDQGNNVLKADEPGPGRFADADIPASEVTNDAAYGAMTAGGFGLPGGDASGDQLAPNGVAIDYKQVTSGTKHPKAPGPHPAPPPTPAAAAGGGATAGTGTGTGTNP